MSRRATKPAPRRRPAAKPSEGGLPQGTRTLLWLGLGILPPLAASGLLLAFGSTSGDGVIQGTGATVLNFALLIMSLTTFNAIFQARARWAGPEAASSTYLSGLISTAGIAVGGLVAYLLTASLMTALVLMVVSLGAGAALKPVR